MKLISVAVKDNLQGFMLPEFKRNQQVAVRDFDYAVNSAGLLNRKAEDYALYELGTYDTESGVLVCHEPTLITEATALKSKEL